MRVQPPDRSNALTPTPAVPFGAIAVSAAAIIAGIILRWIWLGKASLWFDEGYTAWAVSLPVRGIVHVIQVDTAPPLYYILLHGWSFVWGRSEAELRSMSALMATIGLVFFVAIAGRLLRSPWARAMAIVLFSISFMQLAYAHEARFYAMMTMMGAIDFYLVLLACERSTPLRLVAMTFAWTISLYTNNLMAFYLACLGFAWMVLPGARSAAGRLRDLLIVSVLSTALFAPWVPSVLSQTRQIQGAFWPAAPDRWALASAIGVLCGVQTQDQMMRLLFAIVTGVLALSVVSCSSRAHVRRVIGLLCFGLGPVLLIFVYSRIRQSIFVERAFLPSGIVMALLPALAFDVARSRAAKTLCGVALAVLLCLCVHSIPNQLLGEHPEDWRGASAFAQSSAAKHRLVICVASDGEPLYRYYGCHGDYSPRWDVTAAPVSFFAIDPPRTMVRVKSDHDLDAIQTLLAKGQFDEVVLLHSHTLWGDPDERVVRLLSAKMAQIDMREFTAITVFRYKPQSR